MDDEVLRHRDAVRLAARSEDGPRWSTAELHGVDLRRFLELAREQRIYPARVPAASPT